MNYRRLTLAAVIAASVSLWLTSAQVLAAEKRESEGKETKITMKQVPNAVRQAILKAAGKAGKVIEVEKCVSGKVVTYSADVKKSDGKAYDIEIDANGKIIKEELEKHCKKEGRGGKEEHEVKVTLDQLPEAVRATLEREVGSGKIDSIEKDTAGGKIVYSADVTKADGKKYDVEIAADGKLIKTEIEKPSEEKHEGVGRDREGEEKDEQGESGEKD